MSRNHKSQGRSSPVSRPTDPPGLRRSSRTVDNTLPETSTSAKPSPMVSAIPSIHQFATPVLLPHLSLRHKGSLCQSTSYFVPMRGGGPFEVPAGFFPPLSTEKPPTSQTLRPISQILSDVTASTSRNCDPGSLSMRRETSTMHGMQPPASGSSSRQAAPSTLSTPDEEPSSPLSSSSRSFTDLPSDTLTDAPHSRHGSVSVHSKSLSIELAKSPTPGSGFKGSDRRRPPSVAEDSEDEDTNVYSSLQVSGISEISANGRISDKASEELAGGFVKLDRLVQELKSSTGLSTRQIIRRWQPPNARDLNLWNIYQKYFQVKSEEELKRIHLKPARGAKADIKTIRAAYKAFQKDEPNYGSILEVFWRIHEIDGSNTTVNGRSRDFVKFVHSLKRLSESASTIDGFEVAFCAVGSVVHQDQSLSATFCTRMASDFFSERFHLSDNEIEAHLKAHTYDKASKLALTNEARADITPVSPTLGQHSSMGESAGVGNETVKVKGESRRLLVTLKDKFMDLLGPCNIPQLRQSHLPFSDIPKFLAQHGWVIENWPENVPFPCDLKKGKGIASLRAHFRAPLLKAFDDCHYPLKVVKKYSEAVPLSEPVIIGLPPPPESEHTHGRRKFLDANQTADRRGPARRVRSADTSRKESISPQFIKKRSGKTQEGEDVDCTPPQKRRKGN